MMPETRSNSLIPEAVITLIVHVRINGIRLLTALPFYGVKMLKPLSHI